MPSFNSRKSRARAQRIESFQNFALHQAVERNRMQFSPGDHVRRKKDGEEFVVRKYTEEGLFLEGCSGAYVPGAFELV